LVQGLSLLLQLLLVLNYLLVSVLLDKIKVGVKTFVNFDLLFQFLTEIAVFALLVAIRKFKTLNKTRFLALELLDLLSSLHRASLIGVLKFLELLLELGLHRNHHLAMAHL